MASETAGTDLARGLVAAQFPQWAQLPVRAVEADGWDNSTFRLGDELTVRLPGGAQYALQVAKEQRWLPVLAPRLPLPIPVPVAQGAPSADFPHPWSVYRWLPGTPATSAPIGDAVAFATGLAAFLTALRGVDAAGGPRPGAHNFHRGDHVSYYAEEALRTVEALGREVPRDAVLSRWEEAVATRWEADPVWFHGDVAAGNLLVRGDRLAAVIDFGSSGVGDPACDVVIAWTLFSGAGRAAFRAALGAGDATWARGRGWALWKALIGLAGALEEDRDGARERRVIAAVLAD